MDKAEFIAVAPRHYATAIYVYMYWHHEVVTENRLSEYYLSQSASDHVSYLERFRLFDIAVDFLSKEGAIEIVHDAFGPTIIKGANDFKKKYNILGEDIDFPLHKYEILSNSSVDDANRWLRHALRELDQTYDALQITPDDFAEPEAEWTPLPLERGEPELQTLIEAIDDTAERVRADNGYAANLPEEREYVLDACGFR
jgi:hypothetical protein